MGDITPAFSATCSLETYLKAFETLGVAYLAPSSRAQTAARCIPSLNKIRRSTSSSCVVSGDVSPQLINVGNDADWLVPSARGPNS